MTLTYSLLATTLSSFLLFLIQPLAAKALLPVFGGVPAVWNICILYFQGMLLLGYFYAFLMNQFLSSTWQRRIHFFIVSISFLMLPILWKKIHPQINLEPAVNVLFLLFEKLSLPLFIVCATAPLVQSWFANTNHPHAKDPYFLYSASNLGSFIALLGFPFIFEPFFGLQHLSWYWSLIYLLFVSLLFLTAITTYQTSEPARAVETSNEKITWRRRTHWILLSFAPSCLLMAVTQYLTTDIMAVPLLWILPLAIYLGVFIIAFSQHPIINLHWMVKYQSLFLVFPLILLCKNTFTLPAFLIISIHLLGFFALTIVNLGELAHKRPGKAHLTEFYLWISVGGFLGGIFTSLISPQLFNGIYEYHIAFCLCLLLRPQINGEKLWQRSDLLMPTIIALILTFNYFFIVKNYSLYPASDPLGFIKWIDLFIIVAIVMVILDHDKRPIRLSINLAILFLYTFIPNVGQNDLIWQSRNFFGVVRVYNNESLKLHFLMNGSTLHGAQIFTEPTNIFKAVTYYQPVQSMEILLANEKPSLRVGIAGLGTGGMSCQFRKQDQIYFYEIDPTVVKIAQTPSLFSYLKYCSPKEIFLGDARLNIEKAKAHYFDAIIIDVFSSDAIPAHLFTLNAIQIYLQKLSDDGILMFNISNRHINLTSVLAAIADHLKLQAYIYYSPSNVQYLQLSSDWMVLTKNNKLSNKLVHNGWIKLDKPNKSFLWTDDFSNILFVLK